MDTQLSQYSFVFDIGKTHIKAHLLDAQMHSVAEREISNVVLADGPFPHYDTNAIWAFLIDCLSAFNRQFPLASIAVTTHGAAAALIDRARSGDGLVLPVLDYEYPGVERVNHVYAAQRPAFAETGSPDLPAGLNLGRQLAWLESEFPAKIGAATDILLYPQYWLWRLCGARVSEVSSLGCHTDLWNPWEKTFSSLAQARGWAAKFPPLANAWDCAGRISKAVAAQTGVHESCEVYVGVHDSNASYLRYRRAFPDKAFSVVSTGTWSIVMDSAAQRESLHAERDMLANVDVFGEPVVCSRFMGGREYQAICEHLGGDPNAGFGAGEIESIIAVDLFCLPAWQPGCGPFAGHSPSVTGYVKDTMLPAALASLYCALMLDYQLDLVASRGDIVVGGAFLKNPMLCAILARLRQPQRLLRSTDLTGTVQGTAMLTRWEQPARLESMQPVAPANIAGLQRYREQWRRRVESPTGNPA